MGLIKAELPLKLSFSQPKKSSTSYWTLEGRVLTVTRPVELAEDSLEEPQEKKMKVELDEQERTGKQDSKRMRGQAPHETHELQQTTVSFYHSGRNATLGDR